MSKQLQVWGIGLHGPLGEVYGQLRVIVAVPSRAAAVRALNAAGYNVTDGFVKTYGGTTANETEVSIATAQPGVVFAAANHGSYKFPEERGYVEVKSNAS